MKKFVLFTIILGVFLISGFDQASASLSFKDNAFAGGNFFYLDNNGALSLSKKPVVAHFDGDLTNLGRGSNGSQSGSSAYQDTTATHSTMEPMVTISIDDGHISTYNVAYPILSSYGLPAVPGIVSGSINDVPDGHMSWGQLSELQKASWEIASHSDTHNNMAQLPVSYSDEQMMDFSLVTGENYVYEFNYANDIRDAIRSVTEDGTNLVSTTSIDLVKTTAGSYYRDSTANKIYVHTVNGDGPNSHIMKTESAQRDLVTSKQRLQDHGLTANNLLIPGNHWNDNLAQMSQGIFNSAVSGQSNFKYYTQYSSLNKSYMYRFSAGLDYRTTGMVEEMVEGAIATNSWIDLSFHYFKQDGGSCDGNSADCWDASRLNGLASYLKIKQDQGLLRVVTQQEGLEAIEKTRANNFNQGMINSPVFVNKLQNSSFEMGPLMKPFWSDYSVSGASETATREIIGGNAYDGNNSLKVTNNSTANAGVSSNYIAVSPNTNYTGSLYYKAALTKSTIKCYFLEYDSSFNPLTPTPKYTVASSSQPNWTRSSYSFSTPANVAYVSMRLFVTGTTPVSGDIGWFDAVQIDQGNSASAFSENGRALTTNRVTFPEDAKVNPSEGTVSFWLTPQVKNKDFGLIKIGADADSTPNSIKIFYDASEYKYKVVFYGSSTKTTLSAVCIKDYFQLTFAYSANELALYIDGEKADSSPSPNLASSYSGDINVGYADGYGQSLAIMDELNIWHRALGLSQAMSLFKDGQSGPYDNLATGTYESRIFDAGSLATWGEINKNVTLPQGTQITLATRTGNTPNPDSSWSGWSSEISGSSIDSPNGRYLQYRATFSTSDSEKTPLLNSVEIYYDSTSSLTSTIYYVSTAGNDATNAGTRESPWRSLQYANDHAANGDTVVVSQGEYIEGNSSGYLNINKGLIWRGSGEVVVESNSTSYVMSIATEYNSTFNNFTFDARNLAQNAVAVRAASKNKSFVNCRFKNATSTALRLYDDTNVTVKSSQFYQGKTSGSSFIALADTGLNLENSSFYGDYSSYLIYGTSATSTRPINISGGEASASWRMAVRLLGNQNLTIDNVNWTFKDGLGRKYSFVNLNTAGASGKTNIKNSHFTNNAPNTSNPLFYFSGVGNRYDITLDNNIIDQTQNSFTNKLIVCEDCLKFSATNNTINNEAAQQSSTIWAKSLGAQIDLVKISGNKIKTKSINKFGIVVGSDTSTAGDNKIKQIEISDNTVYGAKFFDHNADTSLHSIFVGFNSNAIVLRNYVNGGGYGIIFKGDCDTDFAHVGGADSNILANNNINGLYAKGAKNVDFINNTIYSATGMGSRSLLKIAVNKTNGCASTGAYVANNILYKNDPTRQILKVDSDSLADLNLNSNLYWTGKTDVTQEYFNTLDANKIVADPLFANAANLTTPNASAQDFALLKNSPCIDAGTSSPKTLTDFNQNKRYDVPSVANREQTTDSYFDLGAIEYTKTENPQLASPTHPSDNIWYPNSQITVNVVGDSQTPLYRYLLTKDPNASSSQIAGSSKIKQNTIIQNVSSDGQWYLYVYAYNLDGKHSDNYAVFPFKVGAIAPK